MYNSVGGVLADIVMYEIIGRPSILLSSNIYFPIGNKRFEFKELEATIQ